MNGEEKMINERENADVHLVILNYVHSGAWGGILKDTKS